jgi:hypothetical protein
VQLSVGSEMVTMGLITGRSLDQQGNKEERKLHDEFCWNTLAYGLLVVVFFYSSLFALFGSFDF